MKISKEALAEMYTRMVRIRKFELAASDLFRRGQVKGTVHTYIGMEASGVGACMALEKEDLIAGTHRSHGHNIAKGAETKRMMAEILGKETGYCKGRGGSMHIAAFDTGSLGALSIVGSGIPIAVGAALGFKMRGEKHVAVTFLGDGASNTGNFHESMNMAAIWDLPVIFVLENNQYAVSTFYKRTMKIEDLTIRAAAYGMDSKRIDGYDVIAVYEGMLNAVKKARKGGGPTLIVTESYRVDGHYAGEPEVYRIRAEVEEYRKKDPIIRFRKYLTEKGLMTDEELDIIDAAMENELVEAVAYAKSSPLPDASTKMDYIYA